MNEPIDRFEEARQRVRDAIERRRAAGQRPAEIAAELRVYPSTLWKWSKGQIPDTALSLLALTHETPSEAA